jgi:Transglutaminase-like superfamily
MLRQERLTRAARILSTARLEELGFGLRAWALAPAVELLLATLGVKRTLAVLGPLRGRAIPPSREDQAKVQVVEGAKWVDRAYAVHVLRGRCLPRAVVQHVLHGLDGTPSRLVIGVRRDTEGSHPAVQAHAWVDDGAGPGAGTPEGFAEILVVGGDFAPRPGPPG